MFLLILIKPFFLTNEQFVHLNNHKHIVKDLLILFNSFIFFSFFGFRSSLYYWFKYSLYFSNTFANIFFVFLGVLFRNFFWDAAHLLNLKNVNHKIYFHYQVFAHWLINSSFWACLFFIWKADNNFASFWKLWCNFFHYKSIRINSTCIAKVFRYIWFPEFVWQNIIFNDAGILLIGIKRSIKNI